VNTEESHPGKKASTDGALETVLELSAVLESTTDCILVWDREYNYLFANQAAIEHVGATREQVIGKNIRDGLGHIPDFMHLWMSRIDEVFRTGRPLRVEDAVPVGDHMVHSESIISPVFNEAGEAFAVGVVYRDVTERERAEAALRFYRNELEQLVERRTAALSQAVERLEEHDRAQSEFVSNVSHELKTPLTAMLYAMRNLLAGVVGEYDDNTGTYLRMIQGDCQRLESTIEDILDMGRLDTDRLALQRAPVSASMLQSRVADTLRINAEEKDLSVRVYKPRQPAAVLCDPRNTERIIANVMQNAIKYTPAGGQVSLSVRVDSKRNRVTFVVTDNGIGIPASELDNVTRRYYRVDENAVGSGLGLAIVKEIVDMQGGSFRIKSPPRPGARGTQVMISLPAAPAPSALLVGLGTEDSRTLSVCLRTEGMEARSCRDSQEALEALGSTEPSVLFVDLSGADLDNVQTIALVKQDERFDRLPITALIDGDVHTAKRQIIDGYSIPTLHVPASPDEIRACVERCVFGNT
jgi:two-component system, sensor histidine kinase and response regulator